MQERELVASSNPLLATSAQTVTKKWYEDTVFRNQAKQDTKQPKRFVNDTVRSDFHRKFLDRFIK
jgi:protein CWC15